MSIVVDAVADRWQQHPRRGYHCSVTCDDDWHHIWKREVLGGQRRQGHYNYSSTACSTFRHRFVWRIGACRKRVIQVVPERPELSGPF